jgi:ubiquitin thioesterase protein OTUB1
VSNSVVVFLRLLASAQIRADPDTFEPFLFHPETGDPLPIRNFCEGFVEAADREADHVQITALARALHAHVRVAYLDGHAADGRVEFVDFESEGDILGLPSITLLYRCAARKYDPNATDGDTGPGTTIYYTLSRPADGASATEPCTKHCI